MCLLVIDFVFTVVFEKLNIVVKLRFSNDSDDKA